MADTSKICPQCGHGQEEGEFCAVCGTRLQAATPSPPPVPPGPGAEAGGAQPAQPAGAPYPPPVVPGTGAQTPPPRSPQYAPPGPQATSAGYTPAGYPPPRERGFFERLFDFSFETFITPTIIRVLFIIWMVVVAIAALAMIVSAFITSTWLGIVTLLILAPIGAFLYILMGRVWLELIIILFRIHDNTETMAVAAKRTNT